MCGRASTTATASRRPWDPRRGLRGNPAKLLLDPYAKAIDGTMRWHPSLYSHQAGDPMAPETTDSAAYAPRSVVADPFFDWAGDRRPRTTLSDTVVYEAHVKGATYRHPEIEPELQGTYSGIAHPPSSTTCSAWASPPSS